MSCRYNKLEEINRRGRWSLAIQQLAYTKPGIQRYRRRIYFDEYSNTATECIKV